MSRQGSKENEEPRTVGEVGTLGDHSSAMERAHLRLQHLYDISKVLTRFQGVERTALEVISVFVDTLPLRSAIFLLDAPGRPHLIVWEAEGDSPDRLRKVRASAQKAYRSLARSGVDFELGEVTTFKLPPHPAKRPPSATQPEESFILLPLVVERGSIFGALQIEGVDRLEEPDLMFMNAVVNQLAIAVDRNARIVEKQEAAAAREEKLRFFAEATTIFAASLDYRETLAAVVRLAVPLLADVCFIDEVPEDGKVRRLEVAFADRAKQDLAPRLRRELPSADWPPALEKVMASGASVLAAEVSVEDLARGEAIDLEVMRAVGPRSLIAVPLVARGRTLGVLNFIMAGSGRRYSAAELGFAEELARRAAVAIDNARLYEQAQRAIRARENLLAVVSHDLRNHLGVIVTSLAILTITLQAKNVNKSRDQLARAQRLADRMRRLVDDLLDTSSIEAGRFAIEPQRHTVASLVSEALDAVHPLAASKSLCLKCELPPGLPAVFADAARLQQVFANLLGNAVKFTPEGGTIAVRAEPANDMVTLSVTDTGSGIGEHELPYVFDRFWKTERTARLGTGLGLFLAKSIVEAHGGTIGVASHVGHGSTFFFTLPVAQERPVESSPCADKTVPK